MTSDDFRSKVDAQCELMLDVTRKTLEEDPDLRLCEGLRLIEATHRAVGRLAPGTSSTVSCERPYSRLY